MSEMVERVAKAIAPKFLGVGNWETDYSDREKQQCRDAARAAIAAMRDPTPQMVRAGSGAQHTTREGALGLLFEASESDIWHAMIDAALGEKK